MTPTDRPAAPVVLAAIDDSPAAVAVARAAGEAAQARDGEVVVFTAVGVLPEYHALAGLGWLDEPGSVADDADATLGRVRPVLAHLGVSYRARVGSYVVRGGRRSRTAQIARAVRHAADADGAALIVIGHTPDRRSARSSVAGRLLRRARHDALVVPVPAAWCAAGEASTVDPRGHDTRSAL